MSQRTDTLEYKIEALKKDIRYREKVLKEMGENNPFYEVLYDGYLKRQKLYREMTGEEYAR